MKSAEPFSNAFDLSVRLLKGLAVSDRVVVVALVVIVVLLIDSFLGAPRRFIFRLKYGGMKASSIDVPFDLSQYIFENKNGIQLKK